MKDDRFAIAENCLVDFRETIEFGTMVMPRQWERFIMFGISTWEILILGGICALFIIAIVAVVVIVVTMSSKKPKDD